MSQSTKYYHIENCNRHVLQDGHRFTFAPYEQVGGCWFGVLATDVPEEQAALAKVVSSKTSAVTEITAEQYQATASKKKLTQPNFGPLKPASARAFTGDASDVVSLSGNSQVGKSVNPDMNVPDLAPAAASPQAASENIGTLTEPSKPIGKKSK